MAQARHVSGSKRPSALALSHDQEEGIADDIYEEYAFDDEDDIFDAMSPESDDSPYLMPADPMARCMSPGSLKREIALSSKLAQSASENDVAEDMEDSCDDFEKISRT